MKILFVTQWYQPEPFYKGVPFAKALMERGHEVQVLTGFPNYPAGKVYDGYKIKFFQRETIEGTSVIRVPLYPSHDNSSVRRMANYVSFAMSASLLGPWLTEKPDLIYVYHPPPTTYIPAFVLKMLYRVPVVYDIQDFWPETLAATGMFNHKLGLKLIGAYCKTFYKAADKIVVLSPGFKEKLIERGVPEKKIEVIYNWAVDSELMPLEADSNLARQLGLAGKFNILYAGNMGKAQALDAILKAAEIVREKYPAIQFVLAGGGIEENHLKQMAAEMKLPNVRFLARRSRREMPPIFALTDVLLVHLKKDPLFAITIPNKIQAYLTVGKPILAAVQGDASDLIQRAQAGLPCTPEDPNDIAKKAIEFYEMPKGKLHEMGRAGTRYYQTKLALKVGTGRFEELFKTL